MYRPSKSGMRCVGRFNDSLNAFDIGSDSLQLPDPHCAGRKLREPLHQLDFKGNGPEDGTTTQLLRRVLSTITEVTYLLLSSIESTP